METLHFSIIVKTELMQVFAVFDFNLTLPEQG